MSRAALAAIVASAYLVPKALVNVDLYDEGIRLYGGMRVLHGAQPYHDFFAYYGPAQFYWPAALFALFGEQLLAARAGATLFAVFGVVLMTVLLSRAGVGALGLLWVTVAMLVPFSKVPLFGLDPSLSLILAAGAVALGSVPAPRLLVAGVCLGLASTFRHDFGLFGAVGLAVSLMLERHAEGSLRARLSRVGIVALAAAAVVLPVYGALLWRDPARVIDCLFIEPPKLMEYRRLPYTHALGSVWRALRPGLPSADDEMRLWVMLAPLLAPLGLLALLHRGLRVEVLSAPRRAATLAFLVTFALGASVYALGRSDTVHVYPLHCLTSGLLAIIGGPLLRRLGRERGLRISLALLALVPLCIGLGHHFISWLQREPSGWVRARGVRVGGDAAWLTRLLEDVRSYAGDKPIYVGTERHDRVHRSMLTAYFLTGIESATYYPDLLPGFSTHSSVQERMIADIEASGAQAVVLWRLKLPEEPNPSATEQGSKLLDEYLASRFTPKTTSLEYELLVRK